MAEQQEAAARALAVAVAVRTPVLLWGGPGTGKSSVVRALGAALGVPVETVIASLREPADFAGLPVVGDDGSVRLAEPSWARRLGEAGHGILFLDEVTTAPPAVQAALLRVVLERVVGDLPLPSEVAVVAAANPPELAAGGWDLSAPLANRFCHLDWPVDAASYVEALSAGWPDPDTGAGGEPDEGAAVRVRAALAGFLRTRPQLVYAVPADAATLGRAWPSPRTWDMAAALWAGAERLGAPRAVALTLIAGCVGAGPARELLVWEQEADLPDPEEVLADPARFRLPERGDRQFAVLAAITGAVAANPTKERWEAAFAVVKQAVRKGAPDVAAVAARTLAANVPPGVDALPPAITTLAPVMAKAGILRRRRE
ncbi:MAG TPA: ATP-binding protein [Mycobacteriales bacterium]|jgi:hypothetical protein|nr:ATP-binding protein [Mycobacteriales bacterium]